MTLLEATGMLIDCAKTWAPENDRLMKRAVKRMEKRLLVLQVRAAKERHRRRRIAWNDLQAIKPVCDCGHAFELGEFVRQAELGARGCIKHFQCPHCDVLVIGVRSE
ncbi:MAG: hypothetical protein V4587_00210 [Acidobacteriota bacterium]